MPSALPIRAVVQQDKTGCGIASVAALAGVSYRDAKAAAGRLGIEVADPRLWSGTRHVRALLRHYGLGASRGEASFRDWDSLPDLALIATKWHLERGTPFWHWCVFRRGPDGPVVLDPKKGLASNRRADFGRIRPKWFIRLKPAGAARPAVQERRKAHNPQAAPTFFRDAASLRRWFAAYAATESELVAGFMKKGSGVPSVTWPEAVDEALCVGWIDGVRHGIDGSRYKIRFTPRKRTSHWSAINIRRVGELRREGRMQPAGLAAFAHRTEDNSRRASHEQPRVPAFEPAEVAWFRREHAAWQYFEALPPGYRKRVAWWVVSARRAQTRADRLSRLILACAQGRRVL